MKLIQGKQIQREAKMKCQDPAIKTGIAAPSRHFSNPLSCDPKAGALPGCATPRRLMQTGVNEGFFSFCKRSSTMADTVFLWRRQFGQGLAKLRHEKHRIVTESLRSNSLLP